MKKMCSFRIEYRTIEQIEYIKKQLKYKIGTTELIELLIQYAFEDIKTCKEDNYYSEEDAAKHLKKDRWL